MEIFDDNNKNSASDQLAVTDPRHGSQKTALPHFPAGVFIPLDGHCTAGGPRLSGVKDYRFSSYKTWSRPVVSGNIKDLFACRKMTETFISVNQQVVPFSNGPLEKAQGRTSSQNTWPHGSGSGRRPIWFTFLDITHLAAKDLPLSENSPQFFSLLHVT